MDVYKPAATFYFVWWAFHFTWLIFQGRFHDKTMIYDGSEKGYDTIFHYNM